MDKAELIRRHKEVFVRRFFHDKGTSCIDANSITLFDKKDDWLRGVVRLSIKDANGGHASLSLNTDQVKELIDDLTRMNHAAEGNL